MIARKFLFCLCAYEHGIETRTNKFVCFKVHVRLQSMTESMYVRVNSCTRMYVCLYFYV